MDPVSASIITGLVTSLVAAGGIAINATRKNGNSQRGADIADKMLEALTSREDEVRARLVSDERMVAAQHQIVSSQENLAERMVTSQDNLAKLLLNAMSSTVELFKKLEEGQSELVEIHRAMEVRRQTLGEMVSEGEH